MKCINFTNFNINIIFLLNAIAINFLILAQSTSFEYIIIAPYFIVMILVKIIINKFSNIEKAQKNINRL